MEEPRGSDSCVDGPLESQKIAAKAQQQRNRRRRASTGIDDKEALRKKRQRVMSTRGLDDPSTNVSANRSGFPIISSAVPTEMDGLNRKLRKVRKLSGLVIELTPGVDCFTKKLSRDKRRNNSNTKSMSKPVKRQSVPVIGAKGAGFAKSHGGSGAALLQALVLPNVEMFTDTVGDGPVSEPSVSSTNSSLASGRGSNDDLIYCSSIIEDASPINSQYSGQGVLIPKEKRPQRKRSRSKGRRVSDSIMEDVATDMGNNASTSLSVSECVSGDDAVMSPTSDANGASSNSRPALKIRNRDKKHSHFCLNVGVLEDRNIWHSSDLKELCTKLKIDVGGCSTRESLLNQLDEFHRFKDYGPYEKGNRGSNLLLVPVDEEKITPVYRKSLVDGEKTCNTDSIKSILKKCSSVRGENGDGSGEATRSRSSSRRISFNPFSVVQFVQFRPSPAQQRAIKRKLAGSA